MSWLFPVHTGVAFGVAGRVLVASAGVVIAMLNLTVLYMWWKKRGSVL